MKSGPTEGIAPSEAKTLLAFGLLSLMEAANLPASNI